MVFTRSFNLHSYCEVCGGDCLVSLGNATDHDNYCMRCYMRRSATSQYDENICARNDPRFSRTYLHGDSPEEERLQSAPPETTTSTASSDAATKA